MTARKHLVTSFVIIAIYALLAGFSLAQPDARARLIHIAADSPALDIYVNGELAVAALAYGEDSAYFRLPAGAAELTAAVAGTTTRLLLEPVSLAADASTIILWSDVELELLVAADDLRPLDFGMTRLLIVNALDVATAIEIPEPASEAFSGGAIAPGDAFGPIDLAAGQFHYAARPAAGNGEAPELELLATLNAGASNILVIHGDADNPRVVHAAAATDADEGSGLVRFVHAAQGVAPLDLSLNSQLIAPALAFASPTEHIALPSGTHQLTLSLSGAAFTSATLEVSAGQMQTVAVMGSPAALNVFAFADSQRDLSESSSVVNLINAMPNSAVNRLQLDSGAIVAANVGFAEEGGPVQIVPGQQSMTMILEIGEDRGAIDVPPAHYFAGSYYSLIALPGNAFTAPRLLIAEISLMRGIRATLPPMEDEDEAKIEISAEEQPAAAEAADEPAQPEIAQAMGDQDEAETAEQPDSMADADAEEPAAAPEESVPPLLAISPYAVVDLDPSGRLHLREYPSGEALSLGLLPGGSNLIVLGRRGLTRYYPGEAPGLPLDLSEYDTDPAVALFPAQDLQPADTWLFVMYPTSDSGALLGWVNAYYLQVFSETGEEQRLASLPTVRQNRAGNTTNTEAQPPELADYVTARVKQLFPGAMLNLRMANDPGSEVLTQLPPNEELVLIGLDEADAWAFVDHVAETGEITRGWVSAVYIQLLLHGEPVSVRALRALDESIAPRVSSQLRGGMRSAEDTGPTPIPPPEDMMTGIVGEIMLDPGAMLHLRRNPTARAESLRLIPAGTKVSISGITENAEWLRASYDDKDGWIAGHYVSLLLRGRLYNRSFIESLLPLHDNAGNPSR
ncbi:MAG: DUF4397 domain-containing protein [Chloroflexota bacterium]|nr:DUF4397 domain-containing protein [Chloroflexota bacterium]MDE2946594.1 DUF4397 domain-containing protein [Chloroflexota bacterium]